MVSDRLGLGFRKTISISKFPIGIEYIRKNQFKFCYGDFKTNVLNMV